MNESTRWTGLLLTMSLVGCGADAPPEGEPDPAAIDATVLAPAFTRVQ